MVAKKTHATKNNTRWPSRRGFLVNSHLLRFRVSSQTCHDSINLELLLATTAACNVDALTVARKGDYVINDVTFVTCHVARPVTMYRAGDTKT